MTEQERTFFENVEVEFIGDTILEEGVSSYEDAIKVYKNFPSEAKESDTIVSFGLSKIEDYCFVSTKALLVSISEDLTKSTLGALQQLEKEDRKVKTLQESKAARGFTSTIG